MEIYNKGGTDKTDIMNVREGVIQPFVATDWLDLRIGWLLSVTDDTGDDTITGLSETIAGPFLGFYDRYYIGLIDHTGNLFMGYTNRGQTDNQPTRGSSKLVSSDSGIGTTNTNFWRPANGDNDNWTVQIVEGINGRPSVRGQSLNGAQIHLVQDTVGAGGYATLIMLRLQRDNVANRRKLISMSFKSDTVAKNGDVLYTNSPTKDLLTTNLEAFPTSVQTMGPFEFQEEPDALFWYWPFHQSRLRVHAYGIVKVQT